MSILDTLFGTDQGTSLCEKDIAMDMIKDSKFGVTSLSTAAVEAVNPQLREMFRSQLDMAVNQHFELSDMLIKKGWYPAFENPQDQLKMGYEDSQNLSNQQQQ